MALNYTLLVNYIICFGFGLMFFLFFLRNFLINWMKVKIPFFKTADILVVVKNPVQDYFCVGSYNNGVLQYVARPRPDNKKPSRMINISQKAYNLAVHRSWGVPCVEVDDIKNCVLLWRGGSEDLDNVQSYSAVPGFNAENMDEIVKTALAKPSMEEGVVSGKVFQLIVLGGIILLGVGLYMVYRNISLVDTHVKLVYDTLMLSMNATVVV